MQPLGFWHDWCRSGEGPRPEVNHGRCLALHSSRPDKTGGDARQVVPQWAQLGRESSREYRFEGTEVEVERAPQRGVSVSAIQPSRFIGSTRLKSSRHESGNQLV